MPAVDNAPTFQQSRTARRRPSLMLLGIWSAFIGQRNQRLRRCLLLFCAFDLLQLRLLQSNCRFPSGPGPSNCSRGLPGPLRCCILGIRSSSSRFFRRCLQDRSANRRKGCNVSRTTNWHRSAAIPPPHPLQSQFSWRLCSGAVDSSTSSDCGGSVESSGLVATFTSSS